MDLYFSAREASKLAGFDTAMMLNYLERSGTFERELSGPKHHGKKRQYTYRDLVVLRAINRLLSLERDDVWLNRVGFPFG
jgi:hypothetical protein